MAAPTPVSALVHSSTLVTAGVYILFRNWFLLKKKLIFLVLVLRMYTIIIGRLKSLFEWDIKKIIAFSTLRQIGLIMFILSLGYTEIRFFHMLTHAGFKSLLFIIAGILIYKSHNHRQDIRVLGLRLNSPFLIVVFNTCFLSLKGIFFF